MGAQAKHLIVGACYLYKVNVVITLHCPVKADIQIVARTGQKNVDQICLCILFALPCYVPPSTGWHSGMRANHSNKHITTHPQGQQSEVNGD